MVLLFKYYHLEKSDIVNIIGVIAEYNPFHNGHLYHLKKIKEMYKDSIIVLVLSGNYLQRGEISILNKYEKTNIALYHGIDIVLELPYNFSTQSADTFAHGALEILNKFKIDTLVFGSESNNVENFIKLANIQLNDDNYNNKIKKFLDVGINYPTALSKALKEISNIEITTPNDILALSYIREIIKNNYNIKPVSIKRTNNYHDITSNDEIISASNIRCKIKQNIEYKNYLPNITYKYLQNKKNILTIEDYFPILKYQIISNINNLNEFLTVDEGIENRIKKYIYTTNSYEELINKVKTKRYTYNKISRMFCHILTTFKKQYNCHNIKHIRVLGMNNIGKKYLNNIKKQINIPLITKFSDFDIEARCNELKLIYTYYLPYGIDIANKYLEEEIKSKVIIRNKND